ncbi:ADP-ribosylglycohydrolase [Deinococcus metallilatus]|uniref:ADP-ribosylglycohydrolase n=1 Tax=Deinococcus metallilatus TaxID=1211322 RepID=A0AAJ5F6R9_9DEIO|nr:ADP-ribosylglycohydrolase family protein [Deinococcus metallilatus]MBB5295552.1 ADP-ribosylglycohydrolase [Deinococcus metallilatus]QBY07934.1 ADP-ribosylglycohydrolase [Deinococcus metallilatus]RXJ12827.1 ADP-ribosylglycohydrolase [Deinococcus metallilatus]TLK27251.1 ADP-ribosylglycohydrolase [Deinococcus metallilatus]GMA16230.1 ADP-ribosylglycohydrolase [Deinococcus metallilatus]
MPDPHLQTLLSLTAADALGAATEFKTPSVIRARYGESITDYQPGSVFGFAPGEGTDDSQMTVATLLGYGRGGGLESVLAALRAWLETGPPDVGGLTRAALRSSALDGGVRAWAESGFQSAGNGGLMRIAAVWVAGCRGEVLARESATVTALTHADPRCVYASVFLTAFLEALHAGQPYRNAAEAALRVMDGLDARRVLLDAGILGLTTRAAHDAFRERERQARAQVRARVRAGLEGQLTSQSGFVLDTLEAAVAHAGAANWLACVEPAVLRGDDSDTVACVVGAMAGVRGLEVPAHLLPPLRLGHSWPGWEREWPCTGHFPAVVAAARDRD